MHYYDKVVVVEKCFTLKIKRKEKKKEPRNELKQDFKDLTSEVSPAPRLLTMQDQMIIIASNRLFLLFIAMCLRRSIQQWAENDS